ncbi:hypothetical protein BLAHAN_04623 [Blautia hansenii DSM 20583]|uniref:Uncharacterized protein n=1 Tax=Blautia hansenii DSM 20583 TaxID=537007 RepID=C9L5G6_BLAHA|nr:hypothetical protein BLAHAN_04623 [Blautia hansenii DSM 20583]
MEKHYISYNSKGSARLISNLFYSNRNLNAFIPKTAERFLY